MSRPPVNLLRRAVRAWPKNKPMQREWLRAVHVVRSTSRGWLLDKPIQQEAGRA